MLSLQQCYPVTPPPIPQTTDETLKRLRLLDTHQIRAGVICSGPRLRSHKVAEDAKLSNQTLWCSANFQKRLRLYSIVDIIITNPNYHIQLLFLGRFFFKE